MITEPAQAECAGGEPSEARPGQLRAVLPAGSVCSRRLSPGVRRLLKLGPGRCSMHRPEAPAVRAVGCVDGGCARRAPGRHVLQRSRRGELPTCPKPEPTRPRAVRTVQPPGQAEAGGHGKHRGRSRPRRRTPRLRARAPPPPPATSRRRGLTREHLGLRPGPRSSIAGGLNPCPSGDSRAAPGRRVAAAGTGRPRFTPCLSPSTSAAANVSPAGRSA